jgi:hypothetical protein
MPTYVRILRILQIIWVLESDGGMIYWERKTEELGEKPVPVPLCPAHIPHGLTPARTRASAVRGRRLMTWAMARPWNYRSSIRSVSQQPTNSIAISDWHWCFVFWMSQTKVPSGFPETFLVVSVEDYKHRGPGFDSRALLRIFLR